VRRHQSASIFGQLAQAAPLDLEEVHDLLKPALDLAVKLPRPAGG